VAPALDAPDEGRGAVLRREAIRITEFAADPELAVLVLDRDWRLGPATASGSGLAASSNYWDNWDNID
jgi:hypothetical protein